MSGVLDILRSFRVVDGATLRIADADLAPFAAIDPKQLRVEVAAGASARLVVVHTLPEMASLTLSVAEDARLEVTELFLAEAFAEVELTQAARSACRITAVELASANVSYTFNLDGAYAENSLNGVFLASEADHCVVRLRTNHNQPECHSDSYIKGIAGGCALGEFHGLVYVAPDAQHTDARQQNRNMLLSDTARIVTKPQLEIYADDVKCSHGATVGQMDSEAILYMRQRGLSEAQARRLQIEGFVGEVVLGCGIEPLSEALMAAVIAKLEKL